MSSAVTYWLPHAQEGLVPVILYPSDDSSGSFHAYHYNVKTSRPGRPLATLSAAEKSDLDPCKPEHLTELQEDLSNLPTNDEGLILHHIRKRYIDKGLIYTRIGGSGLVAINPRTRIKSHSSTDLLWTIREQCNKPTQNLQPHVYSIIGNAYNRIMSKGETIFFTVHGEAGSGKSECIDRAVEYLIYATERRRSGGRQMAHACAIVDPFLHVGSDRHRTRACQLRTISFDLDGEIKSWSISVPFLDWDCIIRGGHEDARVFDIFYMVLAGCPEEELQEMIKHNEN